eukprot:jgi/Mesvir1/26344/Mv22518-RA.1
MALRTGLRKLAPAVFGSSRWAMQTAEGGLSTGFAASGLLPVGEIAAPMGSRNISLLAVKNRMKVVKNIQKITKAMKMVAASKLRRAQMKTEKSRGMWQPMAKLLGDSPALEGKSPLTVVISSDRGLCGGINTTSVKYGRAFYNLSGKAEGSSPAMVVLGEKAKVQLMRTHSSAVAYNAWDLTKVPLNFTLACELADAIQATKPYDVCRIIFNYYKSAIQFNPTVFTLVSAEEAEKRRTEDEALNGYKFVGGTHMSDLIEFQFASALYNGLNENTCSEQGARMAAMDSSTRNATEVLGKLTVSYNRSRQAGITTELIEIITIGICTGT